MKLEEVSRASQAFQDSDWGGQLILDCKEVAITFKV